MLDGRLCITERLELSFHFGHLRLVPVPFFLHLFQPALFLARIPFSLG